MEVFVKINLSKAKLSKQDLHKLVTSAIVPRAIAWVSTVGENGVFNLAPFSAFSTIGLRPALVVLGITWRGDGEEFGKVPEGGHKVQQPQRWGT